MSYNYEIHLKKNFKTLMNGMRNQIPSKVSNLVKYCYTAVTKGYIDKLNKVYRYKIDTNHYTF